MKLSTRISGIGIVSPVDADFCDDTARHKIKKRDVLIKLGVGDYSVIKPDDIEKWWTIESQNEGDEEKKLIDLLMRNEVK